MLNKIFPCLLLMIGLSGCAGLMDNRTFIGEMERDTDSFFTPGRDFNVIPGDSGRAYRSRDEISARTPASARTKEMREEYDSMKYELQKKEELLTETDQYEYEQLSPYFESSSERLYYLNLSPSERRQWVQTRGLHKELPSLGYADQDRGGRSIASLDPRGYSDREITLGMDKDQVQNLWGRPARIEVAGDPRHQNERWSFYENNRLRFVFFEAGRVQGWSLE